MWCWRPRAGANPTGTRPPPPSITSASAEAKPTGIRRRHLHPCCKPSPTGTRMTPAHSRCFPGAKSHQRTDDRASVSLRLCGPNPTGTRPPAPPVTSVLVASAEANPTGTRRRHLHSCRLRQAKSVHESMQCTTHLRLPYACLSAFHCLLSLRMQLCTSLCACLMHASAHFTVYSAHASTRFTANFPCACIYALHSALARCMPLCSSLSTVPAHASMLFTPHLPYACPYALHCVPSLRVHCLLSLRMALCISLSTFPAHASMHLPQYLPYACL